MSTEIIADRNSLKIRQLIVIYIVYLNKNNIQDLVVAICTSGNGWHDCSGVYIFSLILYRSLARSLYLFKQIIMRLWKNVPCRG